MFDKKFRKAVTILAIVLPAARSAYVPAKPTRIHMLHVSPRAINSLSQERLGVTISRFVFSRAVIRTF